MSSNSVTMERPSLLEAFLGIMMLTFLVNMGFMVLHYILTNVLPKCLVHFYGRKRLFRAPLAFVYGFHLLRTEKTLYIIHVIASFAFLLSYCVGSHEDHR